MPVTNRPSSGSSIPAAWGLILAAGPGTRFGGQKLLAPIDGRPLVQHVIDAVQAARQNGVLAGAVAVVAAADGPLLDVFRQQGIEVTENDAPRAGLARSLQLGLAALARPGREVAVGAAVVLLGDQPGVRPATIAALVDAWRTGPCVIIRPRYAAHPEEPGHPVVLDRAAWTLAEELEGDTGLGVILRARPGLVSPIDVPGANPDIDTRADLAAFQDLR
jgi:CTP:molybdopterin cytidylyltransferase MocA